VQLRAGRLREGFVGGVANQDVAEAEGILRRELRLVGPDQLLADEGGEMGRNLTVLRKRLDGAPVEGLALDRTALEHKALG
jgi:hypothetical protein